MRSRPLLGVSPRGLAMQRDRLRQQPCGAPRQRWDLLRSLPRWPCRALRPVVGMQHHVLHGSIAQVRTQAFAQLGPGHRLLGTGIAIARCGRRMQAQRMATHEAKAIGCAGARPPRHLSTRTCRVPSSAWGGV